jgi:flagellar hook protein FlgE
VRRKEDKLRIVLQKVQILNKDDGSMDKDELLTDIWVDYNKYLKIYSKEGEEKENSRVAAKKSKKGRGQRAPVVSCLDDVEERWKTFLDDNSSDEKAYPEPRIQTYLQNTKPFTTKPLSGAMASGSHSHTYNQGI